MGIRVELYSATTLPSMAQLKSALKAALLPIRAAGANFFRPFHDDTVIWKAAQICFTELVAGDYLEFGVFRGDSFIQAFNSIRHVYQWYTGQNVHSPQQRVKAREIRDNMRFFAFDSFRGLPEPKGLDRHSRDFAEGQFACTSRAFLNRLKRNGVDLSKVVAVPGWFEDTCTEETIKKHRMSAASIVHIDCDLYESTRIVLKFVEPLLVDGTVLIFDDWYCFRANPVWASSVRSASGLSQSQTGRSRNTRKKARGGTALSQTVGACEQVTLEIKHWGRAR